MLSINTRNACRDTFSRKYFNRQNRDLSLGRHVRFIQTKFLFLLIWAKFLYTGNIGDACSAFQFEMNVLWEKYCVWVNETFKLNK